MVIQKFRWSKYHMLLWQSKVPTAILQQIQIHFDCQLQVTLLKKFQEYFTGYLLKKFLLKNVFHHNVKMLLWSKIINKQQRFSKLVMRNQRTCTWDFARFRTCRATEPAIFMWAICCWFLISIAEHFLCSFRVFQL